MVHCWKTIKPNCWNSGVWQSEGYSVSMINRAFLIKETQGTAQFCKSFQVERQSTGFQ